MIPSDEDVALVEKLTALHAAAPHSTGANTDFLIALHYNMDRVLALAARGAKKSGHHRGGALGGKARAAALSPERRSEIAKQAADARWNRGDALHGDRKD